MSTVPMCQAGLCEAYERRPVNISDSSFIEAGPVIGGNKIRSRDLNVDPNHHYSGGL